IDVDDAIVWSVAPGRDRAQRLVRIRQTAIRAAWNGDRPAIAHAERAGTGTLDELALTADELAAASAAALELMTPGELAAGDATVVLDPSAAALVLDAVARHLPAGEVSPLVTLVDDPTAAGAYGGFAFDDEGELAAPLTLIDRGRVTARLDERAGRARRPGHLGLVEAAPSHLVLAPGGVAPRALYGDGFLLERGVDLAFDPATDRVRLACARARELKAGNPTGRVYADVELVGSLRAVLAAIDGVADAPARFALPSLAVTSDATAQAQRGDPVWRSIAAPAIRTRGLVRPRRSRA
ncbi:MAG TPA: metallopeptidase TldD-related protein, partial [Kofleriaceae bacterium]|nr:metallopeptidase TldD-related protein [Kofleriaceae bacterium]